MMSPKEITALFADASTKFAPILSNPKDDNLTALREVLTPLLLSIPYDKDGTAPLHNLIGIIAAGNVPRHLARRLPGARPPSPL